MTRAVRVEYAAPVNTAAARIGTASTFSQALSECLSTLGGRRSKQEIAAWIHANYPGKWKPSTLHGHLYGCCVNKPKGIQHHPSFPRFLYCHADSRYELYDATRHGTFTDTGYPAGDHPGVAVSVEQEGGTSSDEGNGTTFAYEAHLRDYLARNLSILERGLSLWVVDSELESVEYEVGGRRIDILARDREGTPVIIELKVSRGHERTLGQCLYYRAELKRRLGVQRVRIMIVAQELTADLRLAATEISDIELFEYSLSMAVERVS